MKILFLALLLLGQSGPSPAGLACYRELGIVDGLSQSTVETVLRDREGMLWIGTERGLNLYDTPGIITFHHNPSDSCSLPSDHVYTLQEDDRGFIWAGTSKGLAVLNPAGGKFRVMNDDVVHTSLKHDRKLFFGGIGVLYEYDMVSDSLLSVPLEHENRMASAYRYIYLAAAGDGGLTVGTSGGRLYRYDIGSHTFTPVGNTLIPNIYGMFSTTGGGLYISSYKDGIFLLDADLEPVRHWTSSNSGLSHDIVNGFMEENGYIFCSTDGGGISVLNTSTGEFTEGYVKSEKSGSIPTNSLTLIQKDYSGNIWVGTVRNGLLCLRNACIRSFADVPPYFSGESSGLSEKSISSLYEDKDGTLWVGTDGNGLNSYDPQADSFRHYASTKGMSICSIAEFDSLSLLISTFSRGAFLFHKDTHDISRFLICDEKTDENARKSLSLIKAWRLGKDRIYFFGRGVISYNTLTGDFMDLNTEEICKSPVLTCTDGNSAYLIRHQGSDVIYRMDIGSGSVSIFKNLDSGEHIKTVTIAGSGVFYVGSDCGLSRYDPVTDSLSHFRTDMFSSVSYLTCDKYDRLWIAADNSLFTMEGGVITSWGRSDGFIPNEITNSFQERTEGSCLYLGGTEGLVRIMTDDIRIQEEHTVVSLRNMVADNRHLFPGTGTTIRIPMDYKSISLSVCSNESDVFRIKEYCYTIRKENSKTITVNTGSRLDLPALSDGKYSISASCLQRNGKLSDDFLLAEITILRPRYRSIAAIIVYITVIISVILLLRASYAHRAQVRKKEKERQEEMFRQERKLQNLMIMCHELRTPLNLIYMRLRNVLRSGRGENDAKECIRDIYQQTTHMKDVVNMVLDLSKMKSGSLDLELSAHPFNNWLEDVVSPFIKEFSENGVSLVFVPDKEVQSLEFDDKKIRIVISNLLSNALKFSPSGTCTKVMVSHDDTFLQVTVRDQGIGFGDSDPKELFEMFYQKDSSDSGNGIGLAYSKQLISLHGGAISATSNPEGGAIFSFSIPLVRKTPVSGLPEDGPPHRNHTPTEEYTGFFSSYSMLIVDDSQDFNLYIRNELSYRFKNIYTAFDGENGASVALGKKPDIILCDMMLCGMSGAELCRIVKQDPSTCSTVMILMTSDNLSEATADGFREGADHIISKPFDMDVLLNMIYNSLKNRERIRNQYLRTSYLLNKKVSGCTLSDEQFRIELEKQILEHLTDPDLNVEFLCRKMNYGRTLFYSKVKSVTGMTVSDFINRTRIDRAMHIIETTSLTMSEVSYRVGCSSLSRFSIIFKQYTGMTPSEYRKKATNDSQAI